MALHGRIFFIFIVLVLVAVGVWLTPASAGATGDATATCARGDRPETGLQGEVPTADKDSGRSREGYQCRIRPVAATDLDGNGVNTQMTWHRSCAYVVTPARDGQSEGVAVVDMSRPSEPKVVTVLREPEWVGRGGLLALHEGIHARTQRGPHVDQGRDILVVPVGYLLSLYDITGDCREPRLVRNFEMGPPDEETEPPSWGIHSGDLSPDGTLYYATDLGDPSRTFGTDLAAIPDADGPCLTIVDLADLAQPRVVTRWGTEFPCHDLGFNDDGTIAYVGYYAARRGLPAATVGAFDPSGLPAHARLNGLRIVDVSDIQQRKAQPKIEILGELTGGRNHTEVYTKINGRSYVIGSEEAHCPGGNGRIVDVTDPAHPKKVAEIPLEVNQEPCTAGGPLGSGPMTHYLSVDDSSDAKLVFFTWYTAGLRVFDISRPKKPVEVAYYNPGTGSSTTYPRYLRDQGQIWFGGGGTFNVVELDPSLRPGRGVRNQGWSVGTAEATAIQTSAVETRARQPLLQPASCILRPTTLAPAA